MVRERSSRLMNVSLPPCSTEDLEKPLLDSLAFKGPRPPLHGAGNRDPQGK